MPFSNGEGQVHFLRLMSASWMIAQERSYSCDCQPRILFHKSVVIQSKLILVKTYIVGPVGRCMLGRGYVWGIMLKKVSTLKRYSYTLYGCIHTSFFYLHSCGILVFSIVYICLYTFQFWFTSCFCWDVDRGCLASCCHHFCVLFAGCSDGK